MWRFPALQTRLSYISPLIKSAAVLSATKYCPQSSYMTQYFVLPETRRHFVNGLIYQWKPCCTKDGSNDQHAEPRKSAIHREPSRFGTSISASGQVFRWSYSGRAYL